MEQAQKETIARAYEALETITAAGAQKGLTIVCHISEKHGLWAAVAGPTNKAFKQPFLRELKKKSVAEVEQWEKAIIAEINSCAAQLLEDRVQALKAELARLTQ